MPGTEERTAISVSYRLQGTLEHKVLRQIFVSTVTWRIKSRSTPLSTCNYHSCQCKGCNLRTSNATLAAELNTEKMCCPNSFLTSMLVLTSAIRARIPKTSWASISQFGAVQIGSWRPYLSTSLTKQHPGLHSLSTSHSQACQNQAWISVQERMFIVHWLIWN